MSTKRLRVGDIIEIPLPDGKKGYAQYLFRDSWGNLIHIFDYQTDMHQKIDLDLLKTKKFRFPPLLTRIRQGMKLSTWKINFDNFEKYNMKFSPPNYQNAA